MPPVPVKFDDLVKELQSAYSRTSNNSNVLSAASNSYANVLSKYNALDTRVQNDWNTMSNMSSNLSLNLSRDINLRGFPVLQTRAAPPTFFTARDLITDDAATVGASMLDMGIELSNLYYDAFSFSNSLGSLSSVFSNISNNLVLSSNSFSYSKTDFSNLSNEVLNWGLGVPPPPNSNDGLSGGTSAPPPADAIVYSKPHYQGQSKSMTLVGATQDVTKDQWGFTAQSAIVNRYSLNAWKGTHITNNMLIPTGKYPDLSGPTSKYRNLTFSAGYVENPA